MTFEFQKIVAVLHWQFIKISLSFSCSFLQLKYEDCTILLIVRYALYHAFVARGYTLRYILYRIDTYGWTFTL